MKKSFLIILLLALAIPFETSVAYNDIVNVVLVSVILVGFSDVKEISNYYQVKTFRIINICLFLTLIISMVDYVMYNYNTKIISYVSFIFLFISSSIVLYNTKDKHTILIGYIIGVTILLIIGYDYISEIIVTNAGILDLENFDGKNSTFNSNTLAIDFNLVSIFLFYFHFKSTKKVFKYVLLALGIILLAISVQTTGSKKGLILVVLILIWLLYNLIKYNKTKLVPLTISLMVIIYFGIIYYNDFFQDSLSFTRFSNFLDSESKDNTSGSSYHRRMLIEEGLGFWEKRPILGNGLGSFPSLTKTEWGYSHNNYVEILLSIGFLGFVLYYAMYFIIIKGYIKLMMAKKVDILTSMNFLLIIGLLVTEFANVTYYSAIQAVLLAYLLTTLVKKQNENTVFYR